MGSLCEIEGFDLLNFSRLAASNDPYNEVLIGDVQ
jgi:hypothetical protein